MLVNPKAGRAASSRLPAIDESLVVRELQPDDDLKAVIIDAIRGGCGLIAVAGGDGTVHLVVNAILEADLQVPLGIIPLGTGNDLCRTLAIPFAFEDAIRLVRTGPFRSIDAVRVGGERDGWLVNAATGGFSGRVASEVTSDLKASWGPLAYLRGAVGSLTDLPRYRLRLRLDDSPPEPIDALNIVIANARTAAGGVQVAPLADPEDGLLDVVIVRSGELLDLAILASRLMHGSYTDDEGVRHRRARRVELESESILPVSIDGELCEGRRFTFEAVPRAIQVVAGPAYSAEAVPEPPVEVEGESAPLTAPRSTSEGFFGLMTNLLLVLKWIGGGLWVVALLSASIWLARGVISDDWHAMNGEVSRRVRSGSTPFLDQAAIAITWLGGWGAAFVAIAVVLVFTRAKHYLSASTFLASLFGVLVLEVVLKPLFALPRPEAALLTSYTFPSGHALRGVAIYGLLAVMAARRAATRDPVWWIAALFLGGVAAGICWSRVYLGEHWPTDVFMGALLAATWVSICLLAQRRVEQHLSVEGGRGVWVARRKPVGTAVDCSRLD